jgi:hypothetical protein
MLGPTIFKIGNKPSMNRNVWNQLSIFQTFDLVQREFLSWHGRKLSAERTWEFVSSFIQGREYFESATAAAEAVRPLLLYYGVLSLCRALIIFLRGVSEATLRASHGLTLGPWEETLKSGTSDVLALSVTITTEGTFPSLVDATQNTVAMITRTPDDGLVMTPRSPPCGESATNVIKLDDLLSREPQLVNLFQEVTGREPHAFRGSITEAGGELSIRVALDPVVGIKRKEDVRLLFGVPNQIEIVTRPPDPDYRISSLSYRLAHEPGGSYSTLCPLIEYIDQSGYLIAPWANGGYLTPLIRCFLEAYFLGMLARYFPSRWMSLLGNRKGDAASPLLREAVRHIEDTFPRLVFAELKGRFPRS